MESIEITAANLDQAKEDAAKQLGVDKNKVSIEVLEETKGLFGRSQVRVRAEVKSIGKAPAKKPKATKEPAAKTEEPVVAEVPAKPSKVAKVAKPAKAARVKKEETKATPVAESTERIATEDDAEAIVEIMNELLESSGLQIDVEVKELTGKYVNVSLSGSDVSFLVGRRGEVLNALQYLMNVILTRQLETGARVVVDGDDYRHKRQEVLEKLAHDIATEVKKRGEEAVLDALPAFERRVIHQVLSEVDGIVTYSEGEEPDRRVVIAPAGVA